MKQNKYYLPIANLPPRLPLMVTAFWWMFLDYVKAPEWLFGVFGVLLLILWVAFFYEFFTKESKDIFQDKP